MIRREDLTDAELAVLVAITQGGKHRLAWVSVAELEATGHSVATMERLVEIGLADWWELPGTKSITLHAYGAWLMQVHILERLSVRGEEIEEDPYWADLDRQPPTLHLPRRKHEIRWPWMDEMPDPKSVKRPGEVMRDEDGEEVRLMGMTVPIDRRLAKGKQAKAKRRKAG